MNLGCDATHFHKRTGNVPGYPSARLLYLFDGVARNRQTLVSRVREQISEISEPISNHVCSFACASFWTLEMGAVPLAETAGDA